MESRDVLSRAARGPDAVFRYGPRHEQLVDVHLPLRRLSGADAASAVPPAPVVVLLHGGFWRQEFDRTHTRPMAEALATAGYVVASPEYRRCGGAGGWPQTFEDVRAALAAVPAALHDLAPGRADTTALTLLGHSAGGQLAIWAALHPADRDVPGGSERPRIRRVVALAPVADLYEAYQRDLDDGAVAALLGGSPGQHPAAYAAADAARLLAHRAAGPESTADPVSVVVLHGDRDQRVPVEMSRRLAGVDYRELPGVDHFMLIDPLSTAWPAVLRALDGPAG